MTAPRFRAACPRPIKPHRGRAVLPNGSFIPSPAAPHPRGPGDNARMSVPTFTTRPEIRGTFGVVASTHWLASQTAMGILERGGNAFDAAVAGGFVLQGVEPHLKRPRGDLPLLIWSEKERRLRALCGQGPAPALATPHAMRALGFGLVPGIGVLPAVVPGAFCTWMTLLRDYGTMTLPEVLQPAIDYAQHGF